MSEVKKVAVFYERKFLDRILASYTIQYEIDGHFVSEKRHLRLTDMEGVRPPPVDLIRLPIVLWTFAKSKAQPIIQPPVPFLSSEATQFLDSITSAGMDVIEFGGGNSTLWFLNKSVNLTTVESDERWASHIMSAAKRAYDSDVIESQFRLHTLRNEAALSFLNAQTDNSFDIAFIDSGEGIDRLMFLERVVSKMRQSGWICLDNSDVPWHREGKKMMSKYACKQVTGYSYLTSCKVTQTCFWSLSSLSQ